MTDTLPQKTSVVVEVDGRLTIITINRPERMNALDSQTQQQLASIIDAFQSDPDRFVAIVTGHGPDAFCAGLDLKAVATGGRDERRLPATGFGGLTYRFDLNKPIIAAVNGVCVGGGFEFALACDLIIAADNARFGFPEPRVGTAALSGGLQRLSREIGVKRAMDLILTARLVNAREGYALGFVNEVVSLDSLLDVARNRAAQILALSQCAVRASKQCVMEGLDMGSLKAAIDHQRMIPAVQEMLKSPDRKEGPLAFTQKATPQWDHQD